jgi:CheY-like chemotaxis protein
VEAQGGQVGVRSTPGEGSLFYVVMPRTAGPETPAAAPPRNSMAGAPTVLVIDDDARDQRWTSDTLARAGYGVESAATGAAAIARAQAVRYDAIVLDLLLPDLGGEEVFQAIRAHGPNRETPIIVTTVVADKALYAQHRVLDVLIKPVVAAELLARLAEDGIVAPPGRGKG